jgi:methylphosphotriester-DNA--protein-cysteine methyltransferase
VRENLAGLPDGGVARAALTASHRELRDRVLAAPAVPARLQAIEAWLLAHRPERFDAIARALAILERDPGSTRIDALAHQVGVSRQWLGRGIRERSGLSPKHLARILRLRRLERAAQPGVSIADLAHRFGFHDQAHLSRDVRAIHGQTTRRWLGFHSSKTPAA